MTHEDIEKTVIRLAGEVSGKPVGKESSDLPLTGSQMGFDSRTLVRLLLELMNEFHIAYCRDDVSDYRFNTIRGIVRATERRLIP